MTTMWTVKSVSLGVIVFSVTVELLVRLLRRLRPGRRTLNEVLFFPSETACIEHVFNPQPHSCFCPLPHGVETSFSRLLRLLLSTSSSLDLCMFAFSNADLSRAVLQLHRRGVHIRVLTDKNYTAISGSQIGVLRKAGIRVRCDSSSVHMHHKFVVLDGRVLLSGSMNWSSTAVSSNNENVLVTEEPDLVTPFITEFTRLWEVNDPHRRYPNSGDLTNSHVTSTLVSDWSEQSVRGMK